MSLERENVGQIFSCFSNLQVLRRTLDIDTRRKSIHHAVLLVVDIAVYGDEQTVE